MRFLANENFPMASVRHLRRNDHDVAAICEDSPGERDEAILARAVREERFVLTFDADYGELIYRQRLPAIAIVFFRFDPQTPEQPAERLLELIASRVSLDGKFTVLERREVRQRPLP